MVCSFERVEKCEFKTRLVRDLFVAIFPRLSHSTKIMYIKSVYYLLIHIPGLLGSSSMLAFGDWGCNWSSVEVDRINAYLTGGSAPSDLSSVFLLGDNFYPSGIDPRMGPNDPQWDLFVHHLSRNARHITFYPVLGDHDVARGVRSGEAQLKFSNFRSNWNMPDRNYFKRFAHGACVWFIDSSPGKVSELTLQWLDESLREQARTCIWKIFATHYPVVTCGVREGLEPLIVRNTVNLFLSSHEHNSQVFSHPGMPDCLFVSVGAVCDVFPTSVSPAGCGESNNWFSDDQHQPVIAQLKFSDMEFSLQLGMVGHSGGRFTEFFERSWRVNGPPSQPA